MLFGSSRRARIAALFLALLGAGSVGAQGFSQADGLRRDARAAIERNPDLAYNPVSIIVKFERYTTETQRAMVRSQVAAAKLAGTKNIEGIEVLGTRMGVERAVQILNRLPMVEYAELDYTVHTDVIPNDTYFSILWGMHNTGQSGGTADADIDAPEAWDLYTGNANTVVAVIDTGIERTHADLSANIWTNPGEIGGNLIDDDGNGYVDDVNGWDFYNFDNDPTDDHGHGTHVAGTIGGRGNNATGVTGVNWQVKMVGLKFLGSNGSGSTSGAVLAVDYCVGKGIKVSNNSWGGGGYDQSLYDSINASAAMGHIFVAAAGNGGADQIGDDNDLSPHYPSSYNLNNIISVASIDRTDARSSFSNYGATSVDLGAPGRDIGSCYIGGQYVYMSGTSMATPHVAGAVALLMGYRPDYSWSQIKSTILSTVRSTAAMTGTTVTGGVLNLRAMLDAATPPANTAPTVSISSPANGGSATQGTSVTFTGSATDTQDGNISANLSWTSNLDGAIGNGASFSTSSLSVGTHTITASVTDSGGLTGSANITFTINTPPPPNTAPTVSISSPANGGSADQFTSVTFTGSATDTQDGNISANLSWSSSLDGAIGTGASFSTSSLSVGTHTITASVTDSGGLTGSANITFTVITAPPPPNTAPTVTITSPANGGSASQGTSVTFSGSATDTQDGNISANLSWSSSLDGVIGSGASFSTSSLSVGTHTITASVTDSGGLSGSASITFTINLAPPAAPSGLTAVKQSAGVARLNWIDNSNNETGFVIERQKKIRSGWSAATVINVGANATSYVDSAGSGTFRYRVRSTNAAGSSAWTGYVQVKL